VWQARLRGIRVLPTQPCLFVRFRTRVPPVLRENPVPSVPLELATTYGTLLDLMETLMFPLIALLRTAFLSRTTLALENAALPQRRPHPARRFVLHRLLQRGSAIAGHPRHPRSVSRTAAASAPGRTTRRPAGPRWRSARSQTRRLSQRPRTSLSPSATPRHHCAQRAASTEPTPAPDRWMIPGPASSVGPMMQYPARECRNRPGIHPDGVFAEYG
jgi:hypothetical protein